MKRTILTLAVFILLFSCERKEEENENLTKSGGSSEIELLTQNEIDEVIFRALEEEGDFDWNKASDLMVLSALEYCEHVLTVGYQAENNSKLKAAISSSKNEILDEVLKSESPGSPLKSTNNVLVNDDENLTLMDITIQSMESIRRLRAMENVRYIEPAGYYLSEYQDINLKSSSGFGCDNTDVRLNTSDYTVYSPACEVPWNFFKHNIDKAWTNSSGSGITVGLIDTGVSFDQPLLGNSSFNEGFSSGRSIQKRGVFVDSFFPWTTETDGPDDKCGHGTSMASALCAPRNNSKLPVGVAYNCNLIAYRATSDVFLDSYHEQLGVAKALTELADEPSVKIISMSLGHIFTINRIKDAVKYAYSKGKLIIAAGGTSTSFTKGWVGVIFPANMSETVAVTGITDDGLYTQCDICHRGNKIDFAVIMQRHNDANRITPVCGLIENTTRYIGGSSVATAITAGIAALVWSKNPSWDRDQVFEKLKQSAEFYPEKDNDFGYGCIDAMAAVN